MQRGVCLDHDHAAGYFPGPLRGQRALERADPARRGESGRGVRDRTAEIHSHEDLREGVRAVLSQEGPVVCAVSVSAEQATAPPRDLGRASDGTIVSNPMEDMWPFLPREEFLANMIVAPLEESL